jgi:hypothetical protein
LLPQRSFSGHSHVRGLTRKRPRQPSARSLTSRAGRHAKNAVQSRAGSIAATTSLPAPLPPQVADEGGRLMLADVDRGREQGPRVDASDPLHEPLPQTTSNVAHGSPPVCRGPIGPCMPDRKAQVWDFTPGEVYQLKGSNPAFTRSARASRSSIPRATSSRSSRAGAVGRPHLGQNPKCPSRGV